VEKLVTQKERKRKKGKQKAEQTGARELGCGKIKGEPNQGQRRGHELQIVNELKRTETLGKRI